MHHLLEVVKHESIQKTKATYDVLRKNRRSLSTNYNIARTLIKIICVKLQLCKDTSIKCIKMRNAVVVKWMWNSVSALRLLDLREKVVRKRLSWVSLFGG